MKNIKYKHLFAWDTMMGSYAYWVNDQQERAKADDAPLDAIFKNSEGGWERASTLSKDHMYWRLFNRMFEEV